MMIYISYDPEGQGYGIFFDDLWLYIRNESSVMQSQAMTKLLDLRVNQLLWNHQIVATPETIGYFNTLAWLTGVRRPKTRQIMGASILA